MHLLTTNLKSHIIQTPCRKVSTSGEVTILIRSASNSARRPAFVQNHTHDNRYPKFGSPVSYPVFEDVCQVILMTGRTLIQLN